jgi:hypothetical protein
MRGMEWFKEKTRVSGLHRNGRKLAPDDLVRAV